METDQNSVKLTDVVVVLLYTFFFPNEPLCFCHHRWWRLLLATTSVARRWLPWQHRRARCGWFDCRLSVVMHYAFSITSI